MRIFNEDKTQELNKDTIDLDNGKLVSDKLFIAHHDAVEYAPAVYQDREVEEANGSISVYKDLVSEEVQAKDAWDEYEEILVYIPDSAEETMAKLNARYIPSPETSAVAFARSMLKSNPPQNTEQRLQVSGLYPYWKPGKYEVGDIRNNMGQTYECTTAHDNAEYPDITPDNPQTWANFWRPLHGKSKETARPWIKPYHGTTDMYKAGEYMIYTDDKMYKCIADTVYSPEEYAKAWEIVGEI